MKPYVKPELFYENFELSQHIAACGIDVNFKNENSCTPSLDPGFWGMNDTVFNEGEEKCSIGIDAIEAYCYTNGATEAGKLFNS